MKIYSQLIALFLAFGFVSVFALPAFAQETGTSVQTSLSQGSTSSIFSKQRWGVSYLNYMNGPTFTESSGGSINHYLTLKHKFSPDWGLSAVLRPDSNFGNGSAFLTMGDPYMRFEYPTIYKSEYGIKVTGDLRYYAPLSDSSRSSKILGVITPVVKAALEVARINVNYILIPKLYLNTLSEDGQKIASHGHYVSVNYKLSPKVNLDFALYPVWTLSRNRAVAFNDMPAYPGLTVNFSEDFSVSPYMEIPLLKAEGRTMSVGGVLSYALL